MPDLFQRIFQWFDNLAVEFFLGLFWSTIFQVLIAALFGKLLVVSSLVLDAIALLLMLLIAFYGYKTAENGQPPETFLQMTSRAGAIIALLTLGGQLLLLVLKVPVGILDYSISAEFFLTTFFYYLVVR